MFEHINIAMIGLGPYAQAIHLPALKQLHFTPRLIIELETCKFRFTDLDSQVVLLKESSRLGLSFADITQVRQSLVNNKITHVILTCEPLARYEYFKLLHELNINVFCDKPLMALRDCSLSSQVARELTSKSQEIIDLFSMDKSPKLELNLNYPQFPALQNFFNESFNYCKRNQALPDTMILFSSAGNFYPNSEYVEREGHPFKYGYGHLFHSGFHYVDTVSRFINSVIEVSGHQLQMIDIKVDADYPSDLALRLGKAKQNVDSTKINEAKLGEVNLRVQLAIYVQSAGRFNISLDLNSCGYSERKPDLEPLNNYTDSGRFTINQYIISISPSFFASLEISDQPCHKYKKFRGHSLDATRPEKLVNYEGDKQSRYLKVLKTFIFGKKDRCEFEQLKDSIILFNNINQALAKFSEKKAIIYIFFSYNIYKKVNLIWFTILT